VIDLCYGQRKLAEGLFAEEVEEWWEDWMREADRVLEDEELTPIPRLGCTVLPDSV